MSKPQIHGRPLALCAAWSARVGLRVSGMRPEGCARGCLLHCIPLRLSGRALHARCAREMAVCKKNGLQRVDARPSEGFVRSRSLDRHVRRPWDPSESAPPRRVRSRGASRAVGGTGVERGRGGYRWEGAGHSGAGARIHFVVRGNQAAPWPRGLYSLSRYPNLRSASHRPRATRCAR